MAFGFSRQKGASRGYVNESNADFAIGQRLSRRQYDKYVETLGARTHQPGIDAIRAAEDNLRALRENLLQRSEQLDARERLLELREQELKLEKQRFRAERHDAGQRRLNVTLELYVQNQRAQGRPITKAEARKSPEFKQIMDDLRAKPPSNNPNTREKNRKTRENAFRKLGGANRFREVYEKKYHAKGAIAETTPEYTLPASGPWGRTRYRIKRRVSRG